MGSIESNDRYTQISYFKKDSLLSKFALNPQTGEIEISENVLNNSKLNCSATDYAKNEGNCLGNKLGYSKGEVDSLFEKDKADPFKY